ncbi:hypothetical protein ACSSS7_008381 [Eimeria intestinalis]
MAPSNEQLKREMEDGIASMEGVSSPLPRPAPTTLTPAPPPEQTRDPLPLRRVVDNPFRSPTSEYGARPETLGAQPYRDPLLDARPWTEEVDDQYICGPFPMDICPRAWSPLWRKHDRFGFYSGAPSTAANFRGVVPRFRQPDCPFGDRAALSPQRVFAVIPGPGYNRAVLEPYWLVKLTLREVYREMKYDRVCRDLYPGRFLRRFVEVPLPYGDRKLPPCSFHLLFVPHRCASDSRIDWQRSYCFEPFQQQYEEAATEDYERRWAAFSVDNSSYPCLGAVGDYPARPDYETVHLHLVLEWIHCMDVPLPERSLQVRYPTEVRAYPRAETLIYRSCTRVPPTPESGRPYVHMWGPPHEDFHQWFVGPDLHPF